jgi:hypothetical protein
MRSRVNTVADKAWRKRVQLIRDKVARQDVLHSDLVFEVRVAGLAVARDRFRRLAQSVALALRGGDCAGLAAAAA